MARPVSFMVPLFCAAVLAISSVTAHAQVVRLYCKNETPQNDMWVEIDYRSGQVTYGSTIPPGSRYGPTSARVTDYQIVWNGVGGNRDMSYGIDRINGRFTACDRDHCWPESVCQKADEVKRQF